MKIRRALVWLALVCPLASPALAQQKPRQLRTGKTQVFASGLFSAHSFRFTDRRSFTLHVEEGSFAGRWSKEGGPAFGFGVLRDVTAGLSAGAAVEILSSAPRESFQASLPHPFHFMRQRTILQEDMAMAYDEKAIHILVGYTRRQKRVVAVASGGPSYFFTQTELIDDFTFREAYPFDSAELQSTTSRTHDAGKLGFNVGGWLGYLIRDHLAVGADVRYSRATVRFTTSHGNEIRIDAGGVRVGGGIRLLF